jgi:hypothetical protein
VWFIRDDSLRYQCPPGAITYTLAEAEILATQTEWAKRMVHEAKKAGGQLTLPTQPTHQHNVTTKVT